MLTKYQPHIDLLRALAVFLVILNHLEFSFFSGGFIGVDIFFVLSGYLITQNIVNEKAQTDKFSFLAFYQRRVIRLVPALLATIIISTLFFISIMTTEEIQNYLRTVISSLTLSSNIYYTTLLNDYFSINAKSTPLLHIWSLNLEEQFYLFWPLFLLFTLKFSNKIKILYIIILILISVFISHKILQTNSVAAYYLLPSRVFEFAIGALIAIIPKYKLHRNTSIFLGAFTAFSLIMTNKFIDQNTPFPSYIALIPCSLTAFFIYTAHHLSSNFLRPFQYLGKISYPMYLWHWPIITYLSLLSIQLSPPIQLLVISITIGLSAGTYELLERNIKRSAHKIKKPIRLLFILPSTLIILISMLYLTFLNQKHTDPLAPALTNNLNQIKCIDQSGHPRADCFFGDSTKEDISIFLAGDSHANAQSGFVDYLAKDVSQKGYEMTFSSTAFLPFVERSVLDVKTHEIKKIPMFQSLNSDILSIMKQLQPKIVIMGGYFPHNWKRNIYSSSESPNSSSKETFILGLNNAITEIHKIGAKVVLINDNPILNKIDIHCNLRTEASKCYFSREEYIKDFMEWQQVLKGIKEQHPELIIIDFNDIICPSNKCFSSLNGIPLYRDNQHLTYQGSKEIAIEYLKIYDNPLKPQ